MALAAMHSHYWAGAGGEPPPPTDTFQHGIHGNVGTSLGLAVMIFLRWVTRAT